MREILRGLVTIVIAAVLCSSQVAPNKQCETKDSNPMLKTAPILKGPIVQTDQTMELICQIEYECNDPSLRFEVEWTFNGVTFDNINSIILEGTQRLATLKGTRLKNHLDTEVGCQATTYFVGKQSGRSKPYLSKTFYLGIKDKPVLSGPNLQGQTSFKFECQVNFPTDITNQQIELVWTFNGVPDPAIVSQTLKGQQRTSTLDGTALKNHFNKNIECQARLVYADDTQSNFIKSNSYLFGIQVNPPNLNINGGQDEQELTITSTIPIVCDEGQDCCVIFNLKIDKSAVITFKDSCEHKICSKDWDAVKKQTVIKIKVVPFRNDINSGTRTGTLTIENLKVTGTGLYIGLFKYFRLNPIQVLVTLQGGFSCSMTGDPHFTGFDYKHSYHLYSVGMYTAYEVKDRDFIVQIQTWRCWAVTCVCGVVVKEKNNIINVNGCNTPYHLTASTINIPYQLSPGTRVLRSHNAHHVGIALPSGSEIRIDIANTYMNVYIKTPGFDRFKARGLCGTNDGDARNDFTHPDGTVTPVCGHPGYCVPNPFFESWRVSGRNSLFVAVPKQTPIQTPTTFCACDPKSVGQTDVCPSRERPINTAVVCNGCPTVQPPIKPNLWVEFEPVAVVSSGKVWSDDPESADGGMNNKDYVDRDIAKTGFVANELDDYMFSDEESMQRDEDVLEGDLNRSWPNAEGVTEQEANDICNKTISKSQLISTCQNMDNLFTNALDDCLNDILIGGTTTFLNAITSSFTATCQIACAKDANNYRTDANDVPVLMEIFGENVCALDCEQHGKCADDGKCTCNPGWEGDMCHIETGKGPQINLTVEVPICSAKEKACDSVDLQVSNVNIFDKLKCQVHRLKLKKQDVSTTSSTKEPAPFTFGSSQLNSDLYEKDEPVISDAVHEGSPVASCPLQQTGVSTESFTVSVTKDGTTYSNELRFFTYDSTCLTCESSKCVENKNACHINNSCYKNGHVNTNNARQVCDSSKHTTAWSDAPSSGTLIVTPVSWMKILACVTTTLIIVVSAA